MKLHICVRVFPCCFGANKIIREAFKIRNEPNLGQGGRDPDPARQLSHPGYLILLNLQIILNWSTPSET